MKRLKEILFANLFIKVLALVLAIFTYMYIHLEDISDKKIEGVRVTVTGLPSDWRVIRVSHPEIILPITGPRQKLEVRNRDNISVRLEMNSLDLNDKEGRVVREFKITKEMVRGLDFDIDLLFDEEAPAPAIEVELARYITRKLNVQLIVEGQPAPGYEERWRKYSPTIVDVTGPEAVVKYLDSIPTLPINVDGRRDNIDLVAGLNTAFRKKEDGVVFECDSKVQVSIAIKPKPAEKKFTQVPIRILNLQDKPWSVTTKPAVIDVTVTGDVDELDKLHNQVVNAYIDSADLPPTPGTGIKIGVKFFFTGEWESIRIKDRISVTADVTIVK